MIPFFIILSNYYVVCFNINTLIKLINFPGNFKINKICNNKSIKVDRETF